MKKKFIAILSISALLTIYACGKKTENNQLSGDSSALSATAESNLTRFAVITGDDNKILNIEITYEDHDYTLYKNSDMEKSDSFAGKEWMIREFPLIDKESNNLTGVIKCVDANCFNAKIIITINTGKFKDHKIEAYRKYLPGISVKAVLNTAPNPKSDKDWGMALGDLPDDHTYFHQKLKLDKVEVKNSNLKSRSVQLISYLDRKNNISETYYFTLYEVNSFKPHKLFSSSFEKFFNKERYNSGARVHSVTDDSKIMLDPNSQELVVEIYKSENIHEGSIKIISEYDEKVIDFLKQIKF